VPPGLHYLPPLNPKSEEFGELFQSFLSSKGERECVLALYEEDAELFIEVADRVRLSGTFFSTPPLIIYLGVKALRAARLESEVRQITVGVLRGLCGKVGYLPGSYLLSHRFDLSGLPRASGEFADVRVGVFNGKDVAVKSLRVSEMDDAVRIRKVGKQATLSHFGSLTPRTVFL